MVLLRETHLSFSHTYLTTVDTQEAITLYLNYIIEASLIDKDCKLNEAIK